MKSIDSLGRTTFYGVMPQINVQPTNRELRWLKHIERHGAQSSTYLHELTRDTHRCKDTSLRQLQKLRQAGFLTLPPQQRATEHANFNPYIYDLTKQAKDYLHEQGINEPTIRPHGHWVHQYMTSCVTSSIDILAARAGIRYIPAHEILAIKDSSLAIPIGRSKLIPDQLFALDYGGSFRVFALEVDRGTEPKTSAQFRKSYASSVEQYRQLIERELYNSHYGLNANLLVLWVFSSRNNQMRFLEMVEGVDGDLKRSIFTQAITGFHHGWRSSNLIKTLVRTDWHGVGKRRLSLSQTRARSKIPK